MADRNRRFTVAAIALPLLFLVMSGLARATNILVNTLDSGSPPAPLCSLEDAVLAADTKFPQDGCVAGTGNDTIEFSVTGTITTAAMLDITDAQLTITGPAGGITIDGGGSHEIMKADMGTTVTLKNLTFAHGSISGGGGAILAIGTALEIDSCTFNGNDAGEIGGAIDASGGAVTITNSTFAGNDGTLEGGGVGNSGSVLKITNSTFSGNEAVAGGALYTFAGTSEVKGTIFAASTGGNCGPAAVTNDEGHNISDDNTCGFSGTSVNNSTTLHLDPAGLANNGGPTQTIALEPNSQAVDFIPVASCTDQSSPTPLALTTDQRGMPRPDPGNPGFCDAGAYELQTMPFVLAPNSERVQIARSSKPSSDQVNMAFTFTENGFPACDAADDAFNGFFLVIESGTCAVHDHASLEFFLQPWVVHTVNHMSYGTLFSSFPPGSLSARMVALPTPAPPACGEWTLNIQVAGINSVPLGNGPFSLILENSDGDQGCFDITNAIVGSQIPTPTRKVRRRVRR